MKKKILGALGIAVGVAAVVAAVFVFMSAYNKRSAETSFIEIGYKTIIGDKAVTISAEVPENGHKGESNYKLVMAGKTDYKFNSGSSAIITDKIAIEFVPVSGMHASEDGMHGDGYYLKNMDISSISDTIRFELRFYARNESDNIEELIKDSEVKKVIDSISIK